MALEHVGLSLGYAELAGATASCSAVTTGWTDITSTPLSLTAVLTDSRQVCVECETLIASSAACTVLLGIYDATAAAIIGSVAMSFAVNSFGTLLAKRLVAPGAGSRTWRPQFKTIGGAATITIYGQGTNNGISALEVIQR